VITLQGAIKKMNDWMAQKLFRIFVVAIIFSPIVCIVHYIFATPYRLFNPINRRDQIGPIICFLLDNFFLQNMIDLNKSKNSCIL
jgi:hypothetical protein